MTEPYRSPTSEVVKQIGADVVAALDPDASLEERAAYVARAVAVSPTMTAVMLASAADGMNQALIRTGMLTAEDVRDTYRDALKGVMRAVAAADPAV